MRRPAYIASFLILSLGLLALVLPAWFAGLVAALQVPPFLYLAAALRLGIGVALLLAYPVARARLGVFFLGVVMVLGGIVTPFIGQGLARPILDAWLQGADAVVRGWGVAATLLGTFTLWAVRPRVPAKDA